MQFKSDASFFRKLALGAVGAVAVRDHMNRVGHDLVELERGALDTRIWKDVKRKRVRIPDLVCVRCGVRVESRAKGRPELSMSHSPTTAERAWDYGMVDEDLVAFPVCAASESIWNDGSLRGCHSLWRERASATWTLDGHINVFSVAGFRGSTCQTKAAKGATEGSETQVAWPARFADAGGAVTSTDDSRLTYRLDGDRNDRSFRLGPGLRACVQPGERFARHQTVVSSVLPVAAADLPCKGVCTDDDVARMVASRERTVRFTGCRLGRLRTMPALASSIRQLAEDRSEDPYVRFEARAWLCAVLDEDADLWFGETVRRHADPQMRLEAVVTLADVRTPSAFALLASVLGDTAQPLHLRGAAAWALGCHGTERAATVLVDAFADVEPRVRQEALAALTQIGAAATGPLVAGLGRDEVPVVAGSAEALRCMENAPVDAVLQLATTAPAGTWPAWTLAHLPRADVAPRIASLQDSRPDVHFAVTVIWSFLDSWVAEHWTRNPRP